MEAGGLSAAAVEALACLVAMERLKGALHSQKITVVEDPTAAKALTEAAKALYTSQPGVSKAIIELEEELGVDIFTRHGKRIRGLTEPGRQVLKSVEAIMQQIDGTALIPYGGGTSVAGRWNE